MTKKTIRRLVVKVGTSTLTYATGNINFRRLGRLVETLSDVANSGIQVVLVSSGAIAVGVGKLGLPARPADIPGRQAAAAVGQSELMFLYDKLFSEYSKTPAQMLLTGSDIADPERRAHLVNTFEQLLSFGALPIVNENDSVSVEEILHGDNDCLSAEVAALIGADALVILTDIDGLYDSDPRENPQARRISVVETITPEIEAMAGGAGSARGTGGMTTKLRAAKLATAAGADTYIINGASCEPVHSAGGPGYRHTVLCSKGGICMSYDLTALAQRALAAERMLALAGSTQKNQALLSAAGALERAADDILTENEKDLSAGRGNGLSDALLDRLALSRARIAAMADGMRSVAALSDPVGLVLEEFDRPNGLHLTKRTVPIGCDL